MKNATLPSLRVEKKFRDELEELLRPGETVSSFIERSVREAVTRRSEDLAFLKRGLASRDRARKTGRYHSAADVMAGLRKLTTDATRRRKR
ncbi:MAG: YlcI/YnfO family protein [Archangium sp.]